MTSHTCDAVLISCINFRIQSFIEDWERKNFKPRAFDRVTLAGGVKDFETILKQVEVSKRLHDIKKVVLINHEDCGAYGDADSKERHYQDLRDAAKKIKKKIQSIEIETYYLYIDGTFELILHT